MKQIAIVQFNENQNISEQLLGIADWYIFEGGIDKEFEIEDLKNFYNFVLEIK